MTPLKLLESLAEGLKNAVKNYDLPAENQPSKPVSIYIQEIPAAEFEDDTFYPLICVELLSVTDNADGAEIGILISIGTYDDDPRGFIHHLNLLQCVREFLTTNRIIGKNFALNLPVESAMVEKDTADFTFSNIFAVYRAFTVSEYYTQP